MNIEEKLRHLKAAAKPAQPRSALQEQLELLRRQEKLRKELPAARAPLGIEHYVEGEVLRHEMGEVFLVRQSFPFGRPYGKLRIGDIPTAELDALNIFLAPGRLPQPSGLVFLDTETTGLAGGAGTCAFLIGIGMARGNTFEVRQYFLRDYPEERAVLAALADVLQEFRGLVTFNGKTFDVPLLENRYTLARLASPFDRLLHLDLLHPARRLWKLRLESCRLENLEQHLLGVTREGDVDGAEIPAIYFDYLRTGDARDLQPVFYHNALDIVTLAALTVEAAQVIAAATASEEPSGALPAADGAPCSTQSLDLLCLSRIFERAGDRGSARATRNRALAAGLPGKAECEALWEMAMHHKRLGEYSAAVNIWQQVATRPYELAFEAWRELAIHHEHRCRDYPAALQFAEAALQRLNDGFSPPFNSNLHTRHFRAFLHRAERLRRKCAAVGATSAG
jgi:uncharacterized protein YprB with RNaseH-like and TPR domain